MAHAASAASAAASANSPQKAANSQQEPQSRHFSDEDFMALFRQSRDVRSAVEGWEFTANVEFCAVYRRRERGRSLYTYRAVGTYDRIDPKLFHDVYMEYKFAPEMSQFTREAEVFRDDGAIRLVVKFPFPLTDREYRFYRESRMIWLRDGRRVWLVLMAPADSRPDDVPLRKSRLLVHSNVQSMVLEEDPNEPDQPKLYIEFYDDPGGAIPAWFVNYVAKFGIPKYITEIRQATRNYPKWRLKHNMPAEAADPPALSPELYSDYNFPMDIPDSVIHPPPVPSRSMFSSITSSMSSSLSEEAHPGASKGQSATQRHHRMPSGPENLDDLIEASEDMDRFSLDAAMDTSFRSAREKFEDHEEDEPEQEDDEDDEKYREGVERGLQSGPAMAAGIQKRGSADSVRKPSLDRFPSGVPCPAPAPVARDARSVRANDRGMRMAFV